jgi:hypothetical protein
MQMTDNQIEGVILTPIPSERGYSSYLCDTINGRIWSKKTNKFLSSKKNSNGYVYSTLTDDNNERFSYGNHRLIMSSFTGIPLENFCRGKIEVDHLDEDLTHFNGVSNLQLSSRTLQYKPSTCAKMGNGRRLSRSEVINILDELKKWRAEGNKKLSRFIHKTVEQTGQSYRNVHNIVYGKSWKHLHNELNEQVTL